VAQQVEWIAARRGWNLITAWAAKRTAVLAWLKSLPAGSRIGVESTGIYHELFAEAAHQLGFLVFLLNPKDTRHYAKAVGLRGKTDRVDAELIARMVAHEHTKRMRSSPSPGWIRDRMTPDSIGANGASPNADRPNCAGCSTWRRCRRSRRRHGGHSTMQLLSSPGGRATTMSIEHVSAGGGLEHRGPQSALGKGLPNEETKRGQLVSPAPGGIAATH
jgi:hypothetical protein